MNKKGSLSIDKIMGILLILAGITVFLSININLTFILGGFALFLKSISSIIKEGVLK